ncbi:MAG: GNAT family N-acetyltransferase [Pseudomonadota bacterium]|nr:GNAT family N-acetyltransferase [Pseudomonadota bacterium]
MPISVHAYQSLDNPEHRAQVARVYETSPEFADGEDAVQKLDTALAEGDVLYTAEFNDKVIGAIWSRGTGEERLLQFIVVHPANRGRGVAEQLVEQACLTEEKKGATRFKPGCGAIHRMLAHLERLA